MSKEAATQYADPRTPSQHFNDQVRIIHNTIYAMDKQPTVTETTEHRYEESRSKYNLRSWKDGRESTKTGSVQGRPDWLATIVEIALIGNYAKRVPYPPPELILWFYTDDDNNLVSFTDIY